MHVMLIHNEKQHGSYCYKKLEMLFIQYMLDNGSGHDIQQAIHALSTPGNQYSTHKIMVESITEVHFPVKM